jgi:hypothetical protein
VLLDGQLALHHPPVAGKRADVGIHSRLLIVEGDVGGLAMIDERRSRNDSRNVMSPLSLPCDDAMRSERFPV